MVAELTFARWSSSRSLTTPTPVLERFSRCIDGEKSLRERE